MTLKEQYLRRIQLGGGYKIEDPSHTLLGYRIETKKTLTFTLLFISLSLLLCRSFLALCAFLSHISGPMARLLVIVGLAFTAILNVGLLLLFVLSLIAQPEYFFVDTRDKKIIIEKILYNLQYDIGSITLYCSGFFMKSIYTYQTMNESNRDKKQIIILFVPMDKVDKENLIHLIINAGGSFICKRKYCRQCCQLNTNIILKKTLDEKWNELKEILSRHSDTHDD